MAPLPSNTTDVWFWDYSTAGEDHTLQMRSSSGITDAEASTAIDTLLDLSDGNLYPITFLGFRHRVAGSNVTLPAVYTGGVTFGTGTTNPGDSAQYSDYIGRSPDGRRVRLALFGFKTPQVGGNYRMTPAEFPGLTAILAHLNADPDLFVSISGQAPVWYPYANTGVNAYWRNRIR